MPLLDENLYIRINALIKTQKIVLTKSVKYEFYTAEEVAVQRDMFMYLQIVEKLLV